MWNASSFGIGAVIFAGNGVDGEVLRVVQIPLAVKDYPIIGDSQFQNLVEFLGITVGIAVVVSLGFTRGGVRVIGDSVTALKWVRGTFSTGFPRSFGGCPVKITDAESDGDYPEGLDLGQE